MISAVLVDLEKKPARRRELIHKKK